MPNNSQENLDRRDFLIASIATAGASAALSINVDAVCVYCTPASSAGAPTGARKETIYTGDVIQGKKVIRALDVNDLEPGRKHLLYFQGVQMPTGQHWYVSVIVAKGAKSGKRGVLVCGVHGDERSTVHTLYLIR